MARTCIQCKKGFKIEDKKKANRDLCPTCEEMPLRRCKDPFCEEDFIQVRNDQFFCKDCEDYKSGRKKKFLQFRIEEIQTTIAARKEIADYFARGGTIKKVSIYSSDIIHDRIISLDSPWL